MSLLSPWCSLRRSTGSTSPPATESTMDCPWEMGSYHNFNGVYWNCLWNLRSFRGKSWKWMGVSRMYYFSWHILYVIIILWHFYIIIQNGWACPFEFADLPMKRGDVQKHPACWESSSNIGMEYQNKIESSRFTKWVLHLPTKTEDTHSHTGSQHQTNLLKYRGLIQS